jgi:hypothetical protein
VNPYGVAVNWSLRLCIGERLGGGRPSGGELAEVSVDMAPYAVAPVFGSAGVVQHRLQAVSKAWRLRHMGLQV